MNSMLSKYYYIFQYDLVDDFIGHLILYMLGKLPAYGRHFSLNKSLVLKLLLLIVSSKYAPRFSPKRSHNFLA